MASEVVETKEINLADGTTVELRPLNIRNLRKFMAKWTDFVSELQENATLDDDDEKRKSETAMNDLQFDVYVYLVDLCLKNSLTAAGKTFEKDEDRLDYLEDTLDERTLLHILDFSGGLKLDDPNLREAAIQAVLDQDGEN